MSDTDLGCAAVGYAVGCGFAVFPVRPGTKRPLIRWGEGATTDPSTIAGWWQRWPQAGIGVACRASGLVVVDLDGEDGEATWSRLTRYLPPVRTRISTTGNGRHLWFRAPEQPAIRNSSRLIGAGVDIRAGGEDGYGGFVVAPPSWHRTGRRYRWSSLDPITPLPQWLTAQLKPRPPVVVPVPAGLLPANPDRVLAGLDRTIREAQAGERNSRLYWASCRLVEHAQAGRLQLDEGAVVLHDAARAVGLDDREITQTMDSALRRSGVAA